MAYRINSRSTMKRIFLVSLIACFSLTTFNLQAEPTQVGGVSAEAVRTSRNTQIGNWAFAICAVAVAAAGLTILALNHGSSSHSH